MAPFTIARISAGLIGALLLQGCLASNRAPDRLYSVPVELDVVRAKQGTLFDLYYSMGLTPDRAIAVRNEIVAQRMYAIDVLYTEYESALTRESQDIGFAALTTAGTLAIASPLFASAATKSVLAAIAAAVLGAKSHYDSEVLLAQTIRTIQKQMRASRLRIATEIAAKVSQDTLSYPLAAALSDVEDYYNAGTLTTGIVDTSTTVGLQEDLNKAIKEIVTKAVAEARPQLLTDVKAATSGPIVVQTVAQPAPRPVK